MQQLLSSIKLTIKTLILIWMLIVMGSCSKRVVDLEKTSTNLKITSSSDSSSKIKVRSDIQQNSKTVTVSTDQYDVEIIPEGTFAYNPVTGFTGKAKSLRLKGKSQKSTMMDQQLSSKKDSTAKLESKKVDEKTIDTKSKNKTTKSSSAWGLVVIVCFSILTIFLLISFRTKLGNLCQSLSSKLKTVK